MNPAAINTKQNGNTSARCLKRVPALESSMPIDIKYIAENPSKKHASLALLFKRLKTPVTKNGKSKYHAIISGEERRLVYEEAAHGRG